MYIMRVKWCKFSNSRYLYGYISNEKNKIEKIPYLWAKYKDQLLNYLQKLTKSID